MSELWTPEHTPESTPQTISKVAVFLSGGRFNGDRGSIEAPAPRLIYAVPCDCSPLSLERPCGQASHWHDVSRADELGDMPRHGSYYVKVDENQVKGRMTAALYWYAGTQRPYENETRKALRDFRRTQRRNGRAT